MTLYKWSDCGPHNGPDTVVLQLQRLPCQTPQSVLRNGCTSCGGGGGGAGGGSFCGGGGGGCWCLQGFTMAVDGTPAAVMRFCWFALAWPVVPSGATVLLLCGSATGGAPRWPDQAATRACAHHHRLQTRAHNRPTTNHGVHHSARNRRNCRPPSRTGETSLCSAMSSTMHKAAEQ